MSPLSADAFTLFIAAVVSAWMGRWLFRCSYAMSRHARKAYLVGCFMGGLYGLGVLAPELRSASPEVSLEGLFAAAMNGIAIGSAAYFSMALVCLVYEHVGKPPLQILNRWRRQATAELSRQQQEHRRVQEQEDWNRSAPDRERAQRETEDRRTREQQQATSDRHRRENARLRCLMLYDRHATELATRFSRERLETYFATYLTDQHLPEAVEERGKLLERLIEDAAGGNVSKNAPQTLDEIAGYFRKRRDEIQALPFDVDVKDTFLSLLNTQEEDAIRRFFQP